MESDRARSQNPHPARMRGLGSRSGDEKPFPRPGAGGGGELPSQSSHGSHPPLNYEKVNSYAHLPEAGPPCFFRNPTFIFPRPCALSAKAYLGCWVDKKSAIPHQRGHLYVSLFRSGGEPDSPHWRDPNTCTLFRGCFVCTPSGPFPCARVVESVRCAPLLNGFGREGNRGHP